MTSFGILNESLLKAIGELLFAVNWEDRLLLEGCKREQVLCMPLEIIALPRSAVPRRLVNGDLANTRPRRWERASRGILKQ